MKTYLLRLGEITTKGKKTRLNFLRILLDNLKDALERENIKYENLHHEWSRIFFDSDDKRCNDVLKRVFGIVSFSECERVDFDSLENLLEKAKKVFGSHVKDKKFAVRARVSSNDLSSRKIEKELGSLLYDLSKGVDLENPEITCYVEIRNNNAYFFTEIIKGAGGLPLGSEEKAISLISGGYDSAVASWFMMRKGVHVDFLFFNLGGFSHLKASFDVAKTLWKKWGYGIKQRFFMVDLRPLVIELKNKTSERYWNVLLKRFMFKIAERIVSKQNHEGFITGSSVGQVSSQTLRNLSISQQGISVSVFHPLLGLDKMEIVELSKKIETYGISEKVKEYCMLVPEKPVTKARLEEIEQEEKKIPSGLIEYVLSYITEFELEKDIDDFIIETDQIKDADILIDIREEREEKIKDAIEMDFFDLFTEMDNLNKDKFYLIICEFGLRSQEIARKMKELGLNAKSFSGGFENLKKIYPEIIKK